MEAAIVLEVLDALRTAGVEAWVDGGWGVDALLCRETRLHEDLDLVVALDRVEHIQEVLGRRGFTLGEDQLPVRFVLSHPELGHVDFHTVTFDPEGGACSLSRAEGPSGIHRKDLCRAASLASR